MTRPETLIRQLSLRPHPEGGWYSEVFRSRHLVTADGRRGERSALTTIYFLLVSGQCSRLHRVASDEAWHFHEGDPLELVSCDPEFERCEHVRLGPWDGTVRPAHVVPAGYWQAARPTGAYTLVGCTVGPGFDFADFAMLSDDPDAASRLCARFPELEEFR
ncbi:MAG: cupin domain-containing protein [Acidimicrobiia bacterium]|nr:cupin domain-containing protein [Acidimicrobiia bacterium]